MEDCNLMAADCMVLSCCCQCLVLQFLAYVFLKMPRRLIHRTKHYARKKLARMRRKKKVETELKENAKLGAKFVQMYNDDESMCIDIGGIEEFKKSSVDAVDRDHNHDHEHKGKSCCIEEIERVLEEYHAKGEFGFGSFWKKEVFKMGSLASSSLSSSPSKSWGRSMNYCSCSSHDSSPSMGGSMSAAAKKQKMKRKEKGLKAVRFELVDIVHSLSVSSYESFKSIDRLLVDHERSSSPGSWRCMT